MLLLHERNFTFPEPLQHRRGICHFESIALKPTQEVLVLGNHEPGTYPLGKGSNESVFFRKAQIKVLQPQLHWRFIIGPRHVCRRVIEQTVEHSRKPGTYSGKAARDLFHDHCRDNDDALFESFQEGCRVALWIGEAENVLVAIQDEYIGGYTRCPKDAFEYCGVRQ
jgi:hypothetical protein